MYGKFMYKRDDNLCINPVLINIYIIHTCVMYKFQMHITAQHTHVFYSFAVCAFGIMCLGVCKFSK